MDKFFEFWGKLDSTSQGMMLFSVALILLGLVAFRFLVKGLNDEDTDHTS